MSLLIESDLRLLRDQLKELRRTPYFAKHLDSYLDNLIEITEDAISQAKALPTELTWYLSRRIWSATQFLYGSTTKEVPYEVVYALTTALRDWSTREFAITTALVDEANYYFVGVASKFLSLIQARTDIELVQIALPRLYRHRPLYSVGLYHELGHFVDEHYKISAYTLFKDSASITDKTLSHRMEYFADLFAASYTGGAYVQFLESFALDSPESDSHPATADRIATINAFLGSQENILVDRFQGALNELSCPRLELRFIKPDISTSFGNKRPYKVPNNQELHGLIAAGWDFLGEIRDGQVESWLGVEPFDAERIVNDLVEKSIRNKMTVDQWAHATTQ